MDSLMGCHAFLGSLEEDASHKVSGRYGRPIGVLNGAIRRVVVLLSTERILLSMDLSSSRHPAMVSRMVNWGTGMSLPHIPS